MLLIASHVLVLTCCFPKKTQLRELPKNRKLQAGCWQEYEQASRATVADTAVPGLRGRWLAQDVHNPDGGVLTQS